MPTTLGGAKLSDLASIRKPPIVVTRTIQQFKETSSRVWIYGECCDIVRNTSDLLIYPFYLAVLLEHLKYYCFFLAAGVMEIFFGSEPIGGFSQS